MICSFVLSYLFYSVDVVFPPNLPHEDGVLHTLRFHNDIEAKRSRAAIQAKAEKEKTNAILRECEMMLRLGVNLLTLLNQGDLNVKPPETPEALINILHNIKLVGEGVSCLLS